jgi:hypothetical protein
VGFQQISVVRLQLADNVNEFRNKFGLMQMNVA